MEQRLTCQVADVGDYAVQAKDITLINYARGKVRKGWMAEYALILQLSSA